MGDDGVGVGGVVAGCVSGNITPWGVCELCVCVCVWCVRCV